MQKTVNSRNHSLVLFDPKIGSLSGATTLGQSGPGSEVNEGVLQIPQSSSITIRLLSIISSTLVEVSYPCAERQSVYSTAPDDWANLVNNTWRVSGKLDIS